MKIKSLLTHRYSPLFLALFTIVIMLPALDEGLFMDDYVHKVKLIDPAGLPEGFEKTGFIQDDAGTFKAALRDMHAFIRSPKDLRKLMDYGLCPWWTSDDLRGANFRPLDSFSHWLDYQLYPDKPWLMHAHSIMWFAGFVFLLTVLYRNTIDPLLAAGIAAILYVIDDNNYFPVMWIANRNLIHALFFSTLAIIAHIRWRKDKSLAWAIASPVFLLLSLLSTEAGIATMAYLFAYEVILDKGKLSRRINSLLPAFAVIVFWRIVYNRMGFGAAGGGFIIDPVREPLEFLQALCVRGPLLLFGLVGMQPAEVYNMVSSEARVVHLVFIILLLLFMVPAVAVLVWKNRIARFWCLSMLLCIVPICATSPMNRNLLFAAVGFSALLAMYVYGLFTRQDWVPVLRWPKRYMWIVCVMLLGIHIPVAIAGRIISSQMVPRFFDIFYSTIEPPEGVSCEDKILVVVNPPNPFMFLGLPPLNARVDRPLPEKIRLLSPGFGPMTVERTDDSTLIITAQNDNLFTVNTEKVYYYPQFAYAYEHFMIIFRPENSGFAVGEQFEAEPMTVEILEVDSAQKPSQLKITFDVPMDDPNLLWLRWNWTDMGTGNFSVFELPEVGRSVLLDGPY